MHKFIRNNQPFEGVKPSQGSQKNGEKTMKNTIRFITLLFAFSPFLLLAQGATVALSLHVSDDMGSSQALQFGVQNAATNQLDPGLGEDELPPFPPAGVFEARFVSENISSADLGQGCYSDFRSGDNNWQGDYEYEIKYQVSANGTAVTVRWDFPEGISGHLSDFFGGAVVNMAMTGNDSTTVTNLAVDRLKMTVHYTPTTAVRSSENTLPETVHLEQNYPNPFNPSTTIIYNLSEDANVDLTMFDVQGRVVKNLVRQQQTKGSYSVKFDAGDLASGVYVYRLTAGNVVRVRRLVLVR
ncbi:MAG: T9SS type A sorting domain-containing protein [Deferribacteres bacterium]|nr:T9SS type A sorting domain-containing protein [candidate division KSB1 bacterium]MCB9502733.1 T9SS type A sorting domain-containing protein [Deferribacteres bacterium]